MDLLLYKIVSVHISQNFRRRLEFILVSLEQALVLSGLELLMKCRPQLPSVNYISHLQLNFTHD